jgi:hypothetical protein
MSASSTEYLAIVKAEYLHDYKIKLQFNDGVTRTVDFASFLSSARNPDTTDFRSLEQFKKFRIEDGDLIWGDFQMIFPIMDLYKGEL